MAPRHLRGVQEEGTGKVNGAGSRQESLVGVAAGSRELRKEVHNLQHYVALSFRSWHS
jgi:hypothetical protein